MHQGWFQVAGLLLDFAGVMLLAIEWLVAHLAQRREGEIAAQGDRELKSLAFAGQHAADERMAAHLRMVTERAQDRIRQQSIAVRERGHQVRLPVFLAALVLIVAGFALQIIGSWPGGVPLIGALPG